ncbi:MAG: phosphotransferase family protein [Polyangiaceae bacterium]
MVRAALDTARPIREGETLDLAALEAYLATAAPGAIEPPLEVLQFPSGHSNLTYLVKSAAPGATRELVLRRPPFGNKVKSAHDMGREHSLLAKLHPHFSRAPRPVVLCEDTAMLGAPFYLMERIQGVVLRKKPPVGVTLDDPTLSRLGELFVDTLVELHSLDLESTSLLSIGKPDGYVERQVTGWAKRYQDAKTDEVPDIERVATWLRDHLPASGRPSMIHNDYKYDNIVLGPELDKIVGVLDWEMSTVGDPMMDLGTVLSYWVEAGDPDPIKAFAFGPTHLPGSPKRSDILHRYALARPGAVPDDMRFYYAFALFKNAVVVQQIYARYQRGFTTDSRFQALGFAVGILGAAAIDAIDNGLR